MREMEEIVKGTLAPPGNLKEYSLWLSDFQASNYDQELELPGRWLVNSGSVYTPNNVLLLFLIFNIFIQVDY